MEKTTGPQGTPFTTHPAGWYADGNTMRYWDGEKWGVTREEYEASHGETLYARPSYRPEPLTPLSATVAYLLMLFSLIGICGVQHFYLGKTGRGLLWLFTFGLFGIGLLVDVFTLGQQTKTVNARRAVGVR